MCVIYKDYITFLKNMYAYRQYSFIMRSEMVRSARCGVYDRNVLDPIISKLLPSGSAILDFKLKCLFSLRSYLTEDKMCFNYKNCFFDPTFTSQRTVSL